MVQPKSKKNLNEVYRVGCLGKIVSFNETNDKRFIITLSGIIRFRIEEEVKSEKLYREFKVNYSDFLKDLDDDQPVKVPNKDINKSLLLRGINLESYSLIKMILPELFARTQYPFPGSRISAFE